MVNQSELAFRILCRRYNADVTVTPMLHAKIFSTCAKYREANFQTAECDEPLIAQFCANDANVLVNAAKFVQHKVAAIDLNLGCPQNIAKDGRYGAFLLDYPDLITTMVGRVTSELGINVTCKIRKCEKDDLQSTIRLCLALQESGCKAITVHGRHRSEKGIYIAQADWDAIRTIKQKLDIPVIANGGIETFQDVQECLEYTGCDAVMSSEAILENPYLFSAKKFDTLDVFGEYLDICKIHPTNISCIRMHAFKMLHKYLSVHTTVRDAIASAVDVEDFQAIKSKLGILTRGGEYPNSWYNRHRNRILEPMNDVNGTETHNDDDVELGGIFG